MSALGEVIPVSRFTDAFNTDNENQRKAALLPLEMEGKVLANQHAALVNKSLETSQGNESAQKKIFELSQQIDKAVDDVVSGTMSIDQGRTLAIKLAGQYKDLPMAQDLIDRVSEVVNVVPSFQHQVGRLVEKAANISTGADLNGDQDYLRTKDMVANMLVKLDRKTFAGKENVKFDEIIPVNGGFTATVNYEVKDKDGKNIPQSGYLSAEGGITSSIEEVKPVTVQGLMGKLVPIATSGDLWAHMLAAHGNDTAKRDVVESFKTHAELPKLQEAISTQYGASAARTATQLKLAGMPISQIYTVIANTEESAKAAGVDAAASKVLANITIDAWEKINNKKREKGQSLQEFHKELDSEAATIAKDAKTKIGDTIKTPQHVNALNNIVKDVISNVREIKTTGTATENFNRQIKNDEQRLGMENKRIGLEERRVALAEAKPDKVTQDELKAQEDIKLSMSAYSKKAEHYNERRLTGESEEMERELKILESEAKTITDKMDKFQRNYGYAFNPGAVDPTVGIEGSGVQPQGKTGMKPASADNPKKAGNTIKADMTADTVTINGQSYKAVNGIVTINGKKYKVKYKVQ